MFQNTGRAHLCDSVQNTHQADVIGSVFCVSTNTRSQHTNKAVLVLAQLRRTCLLTSGAAEHVSMARPQWQQINTGGGMQCVFVPVGTKVWTPWKGHEWFHRGGHPSNWHKKSQSHKQQRNN